MTHEAEAKELLAEAVRANRPNAMTWGFPPTISVYEAVAAIKKALARSPIFDETVVERAARAIFASNFHKSEEPELIEAKWNEWPVNRNKAIRQAQAVLSSLLPPSEEMIEAAAEMAFRHTWPMKLWEDAHEDTKSKFQDEAEAVLEAAFNTMAHKHHCK